MEYEMLTSSAAVSIKALQTQLKELKAENEQLKTQVLRLSSENHSKSLFLSGQVDSIQLTKKNIEADMKADIVFLCEKVRALEIENKIVKEDNEELQRKSQENKKNLENFLATQRFASQSSFQSAQKDAEIDFLKKKIEWLESSHNKECFPQSKSLKDTQFLNSSTRVFSTWRSNI